MPLRIQTRPARRLARPAAPACVFCSRDRRASTRPWLVRASSTATAAAVGPTQTATATPRQRPLTPAHDATATTKTRTPAQARSDLVAALRALEHQAGGLVSAARVQLAVRGLQQAAGEETVRVAVLGVSPRGGGHNNGSGTNTARALLRLLLADPLQDEAAWERQLAQHDAARQPLVVRVRGEADPAAAAAAAAAAAPSSRVTITGPSDSALAEIEVVSAALRGHRLEFLLMAAPEPAAVPTPPAGFEGETETWDETVLVPAVAIPVSADGEAARFTPVATPVHQALLVADGLLGAAAVGALPLTEHPEEIRAAVELGGGRPGGAAADEAAALPFALVDTAAAGEALAQFRASVAHAHAYETLWRQGGLSPLAAWLRAGARDRADGATKAPVRRLVASVLRHTRAAAQKAEAHAAAAAATQQAAATSLHRLAPPTAAALDAALAAWAEAAHAELQTQLDAAFARGPWRSLGWWTLFWRADDVTMLAGALVAQRFLPQAEREVVYLAGRLAEAGGRAGKDVTYAAPTIEGRDTASVGSTKWPAHIAFTRRYLLDETVPALQALAQKLVLQAVGASGLAAALGALTYASVASSALLGTVTTTSAGGGAYEGGAVAALGLVWSLRRLQTRWEAARTFWEAGVREEGRKAVRAVEASVAAALDEAAAEEASSTGDSDAAAALRALRETQALVDRAEEALARLP